MLQMSILLNQSSCPVQSHNDDDSSSIGDMGKDIALTSATSERLAHDSKEWPLELAEDILENLDSFRATFL